MHATTTETARPRREAHVDLAALERRLLARAYLFDDPAAYRAGVADTLASLRGAAEAAPAGATPRLATVAG